MALISIASYDFIFNKGAAWGGTGNMMSLLLLGTGVWFLSVHEEETLGP